MGKWEYQNKPCYLQNCVVRELCKRRTACIRFDFFMSIKPGSGTRKDKTWKTSSLCTSQESIAFGMQLSLLGLVHFSSTLYQKGVSWWCHWSPIRSLHIGGICHFSVQNSDVTWTPSYISLCNIGIITSAKGCLFLFNYSIDRSPSFLMSPFFVEKWTH